MRKKLVLTIFCIALASVFALTLASTATMAAQKAADVEFSKTGDKGAVTFKHDTHKEKSKCTECHKKGEEPGFKMKAGGTKAEGFKHAGEMDAGKACGACHDGKKAFGAADNCAKCHK